MSSDRVGDLTATPATVAPSVPVTGAAPAVGQAPARVRAQVTQLAQEFEAMLMTQMLRDLRHSALTDESSDGYGAEAMSDTTDIELGRALSRSGGFGLANVLLQAIERQVVPVGGGRGAKEAGPVANPAEDAVPAAAVDAVVGAPLGGVAPVVAPVATPAVPSLPAASMEGGPSTAPKGPVTSAFGWRRDPFTGATRFHRGVDIGLAYGTPVQAASSGQVVFAGASGGYGNMVVVEQTSGQQTRYAHLSAQVVHVGDVVESGQVIGRVGDTGRATGPHLHFEVLENGRAVNPAALD